MDSPVEKGLAAEKSVAQPKMAVGEYQKQHKRFATLMYKSSGRPPHLAVWDFQQNTPDKAISYPERSSTNGGAAESPNYRRQRGSSRPRFGCPSEFRTVTAPGSLYIALSFPLSFYV